MLASIIIIKNKTYQLSPNAAYVEVYTEPIKIMLVYIMSVLFLSAHLIQYHNRIVYSF